MNTFTVAIAALVLFIFFRYIRSPLSNLVETARLISENKKAMPSLSDAKVELNESALQNALELAKKFGIEIPEEETQDE